MHLKRILNIFLSMTVAAVAGATDIKKETYVYNVADNGDTLRLDRYPARTSDPNGKSQAMIFLFGGGFRNGQRDNGYYVPMFEFMAENGIETFSIDYRLALKDVWYEDVDTPEKMHDALGGAIDVAVEDLLAATSFIVAHSAEWGLDPKNIVTSGSSAGAITSLQAEYYICNDKVPQGALPSGFNFAGIVPMAGAISSSEPLVWKCAPAPIQMFHGDADGVVPFSDNGIVDGVGGLWGSEAISRSLGVTPHRFHIVHGVGHELAAFPMYDNRGEILDFIRSLKNSGTGPRAITINEYIPGVTGYRTDFDQEDFRKAIFPKKQR